MAKQKKVEQEEIKLPILGKQPKASRGTYVFLNPFGDEIFEVKSKVAIYWNGGPSTPHFVNLYFLDRTANSAIMKIANHISYDGKLGMFQWIIPDSLPVFNNYAYLDHTHQYDIYIENFQYPLIYYTYGPNFKIT